ncbi:MAG: sulfotransferase domain-containing protein [Thermoanaerobaculia bacterium]
MNSKIAKWSRRLRGLRFGRPIIVVSGLPRSGTSMAMKMLEAGGIPLVVDGRRRADEDNPKGYYEDERVKDLASTDDKLWITNGRGKAIKIISYLLKELPRNRNYKVLFMRRNLQEILASQTKMLQRRGESSDTDDRRMMDLYEDHLWKVGYLIKHTPHLEVMDLTHREVIEDPESAARQIDDFLGGGLDVEAMARVVDRKLYRNRA